MFKKLLGGALAIVMLSAGFATNYAQATNVKHKKERLALVKQSTVRIIRKGTPVGSGFVVSEDGFIITAFHVVYSGYKLEAGNRVTLFVDNVEVQFADGTTYPASAIEACQGQGAYEALNNDYCVLKIQTNKKLPFLALGNFADGFEGADVYMCGFPSLVDGAMVSFGTLSTKGKIAFQFSPDRIYPVKPTGDAVAAPMAYMDITINRGNSGGPVLLIGKSPKDDRVIGITSFQQTPLDGRIVEFIRKMDLAQNATPLPLGNVLRVLNVPPVNNSGLVANTYANRSSSIQPYEMKEFASLVAESFTNSSLGIGGCVSIDLAKQKIGRK